MRFKWLRTKGLAVVIFLLLIYVYVGNVGTVKVAIDQNEGSSTVGEVVKGQVVKQTFLSEHGNLVGVSVKLATFARSNEGHVEIGVKVEGSNRTIYSTTVSANSIVDNDYFKLRFPPIKNSNNKHYYIYMKSLDGKTGQALTAYKSTEDKYSLGELYVNGAKQNGDAVFQVFYNNSVFNKIFNF
ncbi:hypothetical protein [Paenibacillus sp. MMS18-CY102]|uniref:hypothetical protein n=1 Tax=Paenibacillus sp. MMS18-CY102 TaxID=2682849 RepID=UPI001365CFEF|nr:hypothetical protein [Paenibacillus sp. MMS18-CY102]